MVAYSVHSGSASGTCSSATHRGWTAAVQRSGSSASALRWSAQPVGAGCQPVRQAAMWASRAGRSAMPSRLPARLNAWQGGEAISPSTPAEVNGAVG